MSFNDQLQRLQQFLDADDLHDEALDYMAACGYLTALSVSPEDVAEDEWLAELFAETPNYADDQQKTDIVSTLRELKIRLARELASDEDMELPCELSLGDEPDYSDLRSWCIGFMEGVFLREEAWFNNDEELVSELLLPVMVGSGLFADQPEFIEIEEDQDMVEDMMEHIPGVLTQLFLLFHAPEEKPKPALVSPRK
ncbi:YecA family protein [Pseudomonas neustonica]|uniref:YecA family protein n=1 Tax=Pseudomonas neustonica TaxID=2487346 RepID=A0ABX9XK18_9PSED|nr:MULTISPECIES: YecA family protein [Pseudomonas]MBA6418898.1 YecA family protein [Pseudomonas sp. 5Ae-yellow]ROZ82447.1 YecA family protein [Pseudomonas sp. SSM44]ROZ84305.1 YecA family protein [Pseudomonas neustonica]|tara:strand:+ start:155 stop:745 length:591 start_codon:yes stop_codon:yes gene_type:complete